MWHHSVLESCFVLLLDSEVLVLVLKQWMSILV